MYFDLIVLILSSIAIALLGLAIFVRSSVESSNRRFALLSLSMISWIVFNYLSDYATTFDLWFTRLVFVGGLLTAWTLLFFIHDFPNKGVIGNRKILSPHTILTTAGVPLVLSPYFIESVGEESIHTGPLYVLFVLYVLYSLAMYIIVAVRQFQRAGSPIAKRQTFILFGSITVYGALTVLSNVLIPLFADNWSSSRLGPIFSFIFVAAVAYSIIKYRLFDLKWLVVRATTYVLSLLILMALSFFALSWLSSVITNQTARTYSFAGVTIVLVLMYQPFRRWFEKLTNKIFYQDAYDTQMLLDEFNQAIVSTIVLDRLLERAAVTVEKFIKSQDVSFVLRNATDVLISVVHQTRLGKEQIGHIDMYMHKHSLQVLRIDAMEEDRGLKRILQKADVAIVVQMVIDKTAGHNAYILLGYKKSGSSYSTQDVEALKIVANGLSIAVHNALQFEEIQHFNLTLQEKIDDATRQLRRTNEKLRKLDETKDDFISMASHQLRTPLTSVKGYVSMVLDGDAGKISTLQRKLLTQSFISSQRMVYLISDLLNVSRLKTGKFVLEPLPTNLATVIQEEVEQLIETAKGRNLELSFSMPEHFPTLLLDETKIRQVIMNFIDNAVYYTPSGGHIVVNLVDKPKTIEFTVVDDGIGVPRHEQHHLFSKFFRAPNAKRARPDGTGLGLFMAKKVIIAQGGAVIFRSQEGRGSTFGFTFAKDKLVPPTLPQA